MKILLVQPLSYLVSAGGAHKANRLLMESLAARAHACRVVAPGPAAGIRGQVQLLNELRARGIAPLSAGPNVTVFRHKGVQVHSATDEAELYRQMMALLHEFAPDCTLLSEDRTLILLGAALEAGAPPIVYLAHSPATLPFGPQCFFADPTKTALLRRTAGIITASRYLRDYIRRWGDLQAAAIPFPVYGDGPFPHYARFDRGSVTLINPCAYKGLSIFVALARALPDAPFAAVPTWGTTTADRAALKALPNVQTLPPSDDVDDIFAQTRLLLVPSLWGEAFGQIVVEAMLRGIPVLASDVGGLPEAKLGVDYLLPVRPITRYAERFDDRGLPLPVVPEQDVTPWLAALRELLSDRARYEQLAADSRRAALAFVAQTGIEPFETYLRNLTPAAQVDPASVTAPERDGNSSAGVLRQQIDHLSPPRRALLARRLAAREQE